MSIQKDSRLPPLSTFERLSADTMGSQLHTSAELKMRKVKGVSTSGYLSTWPAHASSQIAQSHGLQHTSYAVKRHHRYGDEFAWTTFAKPRLLERLEYCLRRDLATLDVLSPKHQECKLQAYREVFNRFIDDFKTYKPLLSAIKHEYDATLVNLQEQIQELEPLRTQLALLSEQCERRILDLREQERAKIRVLKQKNQHLQQVIESMTEQQRGLQSQVSYLQVELAKQYVLYRQERDACKLLVANINSMHYSPKEEHDTENSDDLVTLKLALKVCREDLTKAQEELNQLRAEYGDVVPRRDWESLNHTYQENLQKLETLQFDFGQMKSEYDMLLDIHHQVSMQRDGLQSELDDFREFIKGIVGGKENWSELFADQSSTKRLEILITKLKIMDLDEKDFFTGLGTSNDVPIYLRYEGQLRNRRLKKTDVLRLIKDVWREKASEDERMDKSSDMKKFLHQHLLKQHEGQAGEWAYSLLDGIKRYQQDDFIGLFYDILTGKVDESVYHGQTHLLSHLLKVIIQSDSTESGLLSSSKFREALRMAFPLKADQDIEELVLAAQSELETHGGSIAYQRLFTEDSDGKHSAFFSLVKKQAMAERHQYISQLREELRDKRELGVEDLRNAFKAIDPTLDYVSLDWNLSIAFQTKELHAVTALLDSTVILQRLSAANVNRAGPMTQP